MTPNQTITVKVDRSGGIAHLLNSWQFLERNWGRKRGILVFIYIFLTPSRDAIPTQQALWDFTAVKVKRGLGNWFIPLFAACVRPPNLDCHEDVPAAVIRECQSQLEAQGVLERVKLLIAGETRANEDSMLHSSTMIGGHPEELQI